MVIHIAIDLNFQFQISEHYNQSKDVKQTVARFCYSYVLLFYQDVKYCWMNKVAILLIIHMSTDAS